MSAFLITRKESLFLKNDFDLLPYHFFKLQNIKINFWLYMYIFMHIFYAIYYTHYVHICYIFVHMCTCVCVLSHVWLAVTPWTIAHQTPLPMRVSVETTGVAAIPFSGIFLTQSQTCIFCSSRVARQILWHCTRLPWWLRWQSVCLQCGRPRYDPWVRKIPWRRKWQPLQHPCLENPMDGGAWYAIVHGVAKSQTRLSGFTFSFFYTTWKVFYIHMYR